MLFSLVIVCNHSYTCSLRFTNNGFYLFIRLELIIIIVVEIL